MRGRQRPTPPRRGGFGVIAGMMWLLASLATAALSHLVIGWCGGAGAGGDAYAEHAHPSVIPVTLAAVCIGAALVLRSAIRRSCRAHAIDPVLLLARRFGTLGPVAPAVLVATGGLAALIGMEFTEQWNALGRIEGVADALGGNASCGLAIVAGVAALLTVAGLRCAHWLLVAAAATAGALLSWFVGNEPSRVAGATIVRRSAARPRSAALTTLARCRGLRAPPNAIG